MSYTLHPYSHDPRSTAFGDEVVAALGLDGRQVFKTLVTQLDGELVVGVVPVATQLDLRAFAAALGGKRSVMAPVALAERSTGYVAGGISPIGQRKALRTVVDASALRFQSVYVSAGKRGLQVELAPADLIAVTSAITATIATPDRSEPGMPELTDTLRSGIDAITRHAVDSGDVPGVVIGLACGDDVHVAVAGEATIGTAPLRRDSLFRISSNTKPITAAVVLSLVEGGRLGLDQPIEELLPELAHRQVMRRPDGPLEDTVPADREITVRDVLTFTWGFGMVPSMYATAEPWPIFAVTEERGVLMFGPPRPALMPAPEIWIAEFGKLPLMVQPGQRWLYQSGSLVLSVLAARATGSSFADVMCERVLAPLGMSDTAFHTSELDRLTTLYQRRDGQWEVNDPPNGQWSQPPAFHDGGAGLVSSVDDLLVFGRMLLRGGSPVLSGDTVAEMTRDQLTAAQRADAGSGDSFLDGRGWGYGVSVFDDGRYGWDGGLGSTWSNVPDQDLTLVVLTNRAADENGMPVVCEAALEAVLG